MSGALARLDRITAHQPSAIRPADPLAVGSGEGPRVNQLDALRRVDVALRPEQVDLEGQVRGGELTALTRSSDDLRLPPPPRPAVDGPQLMQATARALDTFKEQAGRPVGADGAALVAEGRMMALLGGIERLKRDIAARTERATLA